MAWPARAAGTVAVHGAEVQTFLQDLKSVSQVSLRSAPPDFAVPPKSTSRCRASS